MSSNKKCSVFAQNQPCEIHQSGLIFASGISLHLRVTNQANSMKPLFESVNEKFDNYFRTYLSILTVIDQM